MHSVSCEFSFAFGPEKPNVVAFAAFSRRKRMVRETIARIVIDIPFILLCEESSVSLGRVVRLLILSPLFILPGSRELFAGPFSAPTGRLPLVFEENRGQAPPETRYLLRGGSIEGEFARDGVLLRLLGDKTIASQVKMRLLHTLGGVAITGGGQAEGQTNYLLGNNPDHWLRGVPNYSEVRYGRIYAGTDLVFYGNDGDLEHDFELQPGADPKRIAFRLEGAKNVALDGARGLEITLANGKIAFSRPIAYQLVQGVRRGVEAAFTLGHDGTIRFRLGAFDPAEKLVIDPVLSFATYLSQYAPDANLIAADANGNSYVAGYAGVGYPVTSGAFVGCTTCTTGGVATFVSKLSADGTKLIYSTLLGGNSFAQPTGIAVDLNGNVLVSGWTGATDFPTKNGQPFAPPNNAYLGFLFSLSADGSALNYGTMLGSPPSVSPAAMTYATAVAVDGSGNAYVTGETGDGFYTTAGALNQATTGLSRNSFDVYLAKFSPNGTLVYSAVLGTADPQNGGGGPIGASAIAVDAAGDAFVAGQAGTLWPITSGAYLSQIAGPYPYATPFVTKVAPDAKRLVYSTYLDYAYSLANIAALSNGDVLITGNGAGPTYPTTPNAYQANTVGGQFVTELNSTGTGLVSSTMFPASQINGMTVDLDGNIWLAGQTTSPQYPLVSPIQGTFPISNGFPEPVSVVSELDATGQTLKFSTYLGGSAFGYANSVAVDSNRKVHVSGAAQYGMYTTPGVYAGSVPAPGPGYTSETFAYVTVIDPTSSTGALCLGGTADYGLSFGYLALQTTASQTVQATNCGQGSLTFTSVASNNAAFTVPAGSNSCTGMLAAGASCSVTVQFEPTALQAYSGQLTFTSNASVGTTSVPLTGSGGAPSASFGPYGITQNLIFPATLTGQTTQPELIALYNNGTVPLTVYLSQITVTSGFVLTPGGTCTSPVSPNQSCLIPIAFAPKTGGNYNGTLSVTTNDPVNPTITASLKGTAFDTYPLATITALLNPSYPANSGTAPITMDIFGTNFFPTSVVYINGIAQTTAYQGDSFLTVTFNPSLLSTPGQIPVTVVNPAPGGGSSASYPLTVYLSLPLTASALTVDPVGGLLYAAIPASATQNPSTVIPINPSTGAMMTPIAVSSDPQKLAISDDGSELYVASAGVLQRINLKTLAIERTFNLPVDPSFGQTYVQEMHVLPGSPQSIVVELFANVDPAEDGAALYNDAGLVNWIPGQSLVNGGNTIFSLDSFTFASSPSVIYGLPVPITSSFFAEVQVSPSGLTLGSSSYGQINQQSGSIVRSDGTLLYTNSGEVWDPSTQKLLGTYLGSNGSQLFYTPGLLPEKATGHTYFLNTDEQYFEFQAAIIDVYDQASYALLGGVPFTNLNGPSLSDLVRWGSNGFAFRGFDNSGTLPNANQIVIVTSNLVTSSGNTPIPILSSVFPTSVDAGTPGYAMQVTGSGFTGASTVLVNGSPRTTTYESSTSLTAQVLASDIATTGQFNVEVTTPAPGGGASDFVVVSILPPKQLTPTVGVTPSTTSITTGRPLTITVAVNGAGGKPTPTGSVILNGGGYTSASTLLSGGTASINIPAGSLPAGTVTLSVAYTPDGSSSSTYNSAVGSTVVTVTGLGNVASTLTIAPAAATITNQQSVSVPVAVAGPSGQAAPTGTVSLTSGTYISQQPLSGGAASFTIPAGTLGNGANTLVASYTGDGTYAGSSGTATVTVTQVVMSASTPSGVSPGSSTTSTVTLNAGSNYSGTMNVTCSLTTSPAGAQSLPTCSLNPASLNMTSGGSGSTMITVKTTAASTTGQITPNAKKLFGLGGATILAGLLLIGVPGRFRRAFSVMVLLGFVALAGISGCGGGSSNAGSGGSTTPATTAGTYKFTVTATDSVNSTVSASATVAVTVQ